MLPKKNQNQLDNERLWKSQEKEPISVLDRKVSFLQINNKLDNWINSKTSEEYCVLTLAKPVS
jgi:hypothetical protein